jgi:hypothetical protein
MEAALGTDFSAVRVHIGPQPQRIGAIAFTIGTDIYFAPGQFQPETVQGQQLLGHELAHVVQQRAGRVRAPVGMGVAVVQDRALEAEAGRIGHRAAAYPGVAQPSIETGALPSKPSALRLSASVQRQEDDDDDFEVPAEYRPPPLPTLGDWLTPALRRAAMYPTYRARVTNLPAPIPQYGVLVPGLVPQRGVLVHAPVPQRAQVVRTPRDRRAQQPPPQPQPTRAKKKKFVPLILTAPDVGSYVSTLVTPGHHTFHDIVIFTLNNNPGYNQIHVHRNAARVVIQISKKHTTTQGNGPAVLLGSQLGQEAIAKAANY